MKIKLKEGVSVADIPKLSSEYKKICIMFNDADTIEVDSIPGKLVNYVEEVVEKTSSKKKGDK
tara:strand:+ start:357 stop:545 length:189 start_codon:yes stop_codon:yes gene_type:complete